MDTNDKRRPVKLDNVYVTDDSLIRNIEENEDDIVVTFKARPSASVKVTIKKDTILEWNDDYAGGATPSDEEEWLTRASALTETKADWDNHQPATGTGYITFVIHNGVNQKYLINGRFIIFINGTAYQAHYREPNNVTNGQHWYYGTKVGNTVYPTNFVLEPGDDLTISVPLVRTLPTGVTQTIPVGGTFSGNNNRPCVIYASALDASDHDSYLHNVELNVFDYTDQGSNVTPGTTTIEAGSTYNLIIGSTSNYALDGDASTGDKAYKRYERTSGLVLVPVRLSDWAEE